MDHLARLESLGSAHHRRRYGNAYAYVGTACPIPWVQCGRVDYVAFHPDGPTIFRQVHPLTIRTSRGDLTMQYGQHLYAMSSTVGQIDTTICRQTCGTAVRAPGLRRPFGGDRGRRPALTVRSTALNFRQDLLFLPKNHCDLHHRLGGQIPASPSGKTRGLSGPFCPADPGCSRTYRGRPGSCVGPGCACETSGMPGWGFQGGLEKHVRPAVFL